MKYRDRKLETLVDQLSEAMESYGRELWDIETVLALLENMVVHLRNPVKEGGEPEERKLTAYFNFFPKHCPNCGTRVHWTGKTLIELFYHKEKYRKGNKRICSFCTLEHSRMYSKDNEMDSHDRLNTQRKLKALYNFFPKHCPNCGTRAHWKGDTLIDVFLEKKKYRNGEIAMCTHCELDHHRIDVMNA